MSELPDQHNMQPNDSTTSGKKTKRTSTDWVIIAAAASVFLIAVFAPLAMLHFRHTRERAQIKENLRQIGLALEQYSNSQSSEVIGSESKAEP